MSQNWKKPSYPKPTYKKTQKPTWQKPTKYSPPKNKYSNKGWKKNDKPTYTAPQEYDHEPMYESETYEKEPVYSWFQNPYADRTRRSAMKAQLEEGKEAVSHIYNPYDIRQRGIVKAQLEERIESDKQELAALDELEPVSDEQQDLDGEGVIESTSTDETVEKEAVSHIFNPYDIRKRRSAMRAAIEKSIDDEIAGLAELDELERQEEDGVKQVASGLPNGERCNSRFQCASICCSRFGAEFGRCRARVAVGLFFTNCEGQ